MKAWNPASVACALALALGAAATSLQTQAAPATPAVAAPSLSLERLFRAQPYRGEPARELQFSHSGRYLAYLWNPFGEPGTDLYLHDTQTGRTLRVTSPAVMAAYEAPEDLSRYERKARQRQTEWDERQQREELQQAYLRGENVDLGQFEARALEQLRKELAEKKVRDEAEKAADKAEAEIEKKAAEALAARRSGKPVAEAAAPAASAASAATKSADKDKELWELRDELKKKEARNKLKPGDLYPGVSQVVWANQRDELIFQYRGSLFRWQAADGKVQSLLGTQRALRMVAYTPDDQGFIYQDETRVLRSRFSAAGVQVLNRELIHDDDAERKYR
ncbi:MAG TPA: hypothetical protein VK195_05055, partial [Burkholderiaceae bacterium]|nr:hypothetical protein [Burkholderiaceae bacterium]